jgi:hypothetical protein
MMLAQAKDLSVRMMRQQEEATDGTAKINAGWSNLLGTFEFELDHVGDPAGLVFAVFERAWANRRCTARPCQPQSGPSPTSP